MCQSNSIRDVLDGMRPRVQTIRTGADAAPPSTRPLLEEALSELRTAMDALQVSEEELRVQAEEMAEQQFAVELDLLRYREIFRLSPDARVVTDTDGMVRDANDAAIRLLRSRPEMVAGKPLAAFVPEEDRRAFRAVLRRLAHHEAVETELRLLPRESLPVEVEVAAAARSARVGGPVEVHWTFRDVTERRAAAAAGLETAEVYRAVMDCSPVPTVAMDLDGTVLLWNAAAAALLGWTADEVTGRRNPALSEDEVARSRDVAGRGGEGRPVLARRRDGAPVPVTLRDATLAGPDGRARGVVCTLLPAGDEEEHDDDARPAAAHPAESGADDARQARWTREESLAVLRATVGAGRPGDVAARLRAWIANGLHLGYLRPDDRLPSIREVSQGCSVDHRAVSAAYRTLAAEGVVEVRSRHGVYVGAVPTPADAGLSEAAEWLAGVLGDAAALQLKVPLLPDLVREWTGATRVTCACLDDTEDGLVALSTELRQAWGLETYPVPVGDGRTGRFDEAALTAELRRADVVVTTPFHAAQVGAVAAALGRPLVVLRANPEMVRTVEERLAGGTVTAVVADAAYGERLRSIRGGQDPARLRVVPVADAAALAALDPAQPVLLTRAAQQRLGGAGMRLLVPISPSFCPASARHLAPVLIRCNVQAGRACR